MNTTKETEKVVTLEDLEFTMDLIMAKAQEAEDMYQEISIGRYERY